MNYSVFILSHKRADRVETYSTLRNSGYTGEIYIVIDDEDPQCSLYQERFENVLVFNKEMWINSTDTVTNDKKKSSPVYARNFIEQTARDMGYDAYIVMDDDIINLRFRYIENYVAKSQALKSNLDEVLSEYMNYLVSANIATLSFALHIQSTFSP